MKRRLASCLLATVLAAVSAGFAEQPSGPGGPPPLRRGPQDRDRERGSARFLESLPPELRERFRAAREKALEDPKILQLRQAADEANKEFFKGVRAKMLEIDPELGEVIKKEARGRRGRERDDNVPGFAKLDEAERQKLMAAREKARSDPAVREAEKKKQGARSPEEREAASEEYRKTMRDAMLKSDPSLGPILDKIKPPVASEGAQPGPPAMDGGPDS